MNIAGLKALQNIDYHSIDKEKLVDAGAVTLNKNGSITERIEQFIDEVENPYIIKCGKTFVEVEFSDTKKTIENQLEKYLKSLKMG